MKLEVGMYVRTKNGYIDKIISIDYAEEKRNKYPNHPSKSCWRDKILLLKVGYWRTTQNILKASHNIIDLIEVGDYVNGYLIIRKTTTLLTKQLSDIKPNDIKSIVTKEQFESMSYKVGE